MVRGLLWGGSTPASGVRWVSAQHTFLKASLKSRPPPSPSPSFRPPLSLHPVLHKELGPGGACPTMWGLSTDPLRLSVGGEGRGPCPGLQPTPALPYLPGTLWSPGVLALWPQVRWCLGQPGSQTLESGTHAALFSARRKVGLGCRDGPPLPFPRGVCGAPSWISRRSILALFPGN